MKRKAKNSKAMKKSNGKKPIVKPETNGGNILLATRVPRELHARIHKLAEADGRSVSQYLERKLSELFRPLAEAK